MRKKLRWYDIRDGFQLCVLVPFIIFLLVHIVITCPKADVPKYHTVQVLDTENKIIESWQFEKMETHKHTQIFTSNTYQIVIVVKEK